MKENCTFYAFKDTGKYYTEARGVYHNEWSILPRQEQLHRIVQAHGNWPGLSTDGSGMHRLVIPDDGVPFMSPLGKGGE